MSCCISARPEVVLGSRDCAIRQADDVHLHAARHAVRVQQSHFRFQVHKRKWLMRGWHKQPAQLGHVLSSSTTVECADQTSRVTAVAFGTVHRRGKAHPDMHFTPEVIALAGANVQAVLQRHADMQAARSCAWISPHLQTGRTTPVAFMAAKVPHNRESPCRCLYACMHAATVATQSEPAARTASAVGCMNGAHAAQPSGCAAAEPAPSQTTLVSLICREDGSEHYPCMLCAYASAFQLTGAAAVDGFCYAQAQYGSCGYV